MLYEPCNFYRTGSQGNIAPISKVRVPDRRPDMKYLYDSMIIQVSARFLFFLGMGIWLGGIVFLGYGVAPVNFQTAEEWQLTGENPNLSDQQVNERTIGGELTAESINRLNHLEYAGIMLALAGLALSWAQSGNRGKLLITRTVLLLAMGVLLVYYAEFIGGRLNEIRETVALDFTTTHPDMIPEEQEEFDRLHSRYTQLSSITALLCVVQLALASWMPESLKTNDHHES